ncbi:hypothetical protein VPH35_093065 [Triticum aestivum]|uniref:Uncharacterized protein n=1 Tax=Triticum aestivum TaxID=4565 RepID=A0A3B6LV18_WHEAT|nr:uncharacterized protein LOC123113662 [Triticum aestivum]
MARELGGALCRTPARDPASALGSDENARPGGASTPAPAEPIATSRHPLRAIQPPGQPRRPAPTPKKGKEARTAGKTSARIGAVSTPLGPTKILGKPKPVPRQGFLTMGASSAQVQRSKVRNPILLREENRNVQNVSSTLQQDDSHAPAKEEDNSEDTLSLQLELAITETILADEMKARAEAEVRATALGDELKAANLRTLEACRQKEATEKELKDTLSVLDVVESEQICLIKEVEELKKKNLEQVSLIKELEELKKNNFQSPVFHKKRDVETLILNTELEQEMDEIHRQAMCETSEVIISLQKQLLSLQQQLDACNKKELLAAKRLVLLDQSTEILVQKEVLEQCFVSLLRGMEEETRQLESKLDQSNRFYEGRIKELEIKMQEMDYQAGALLISWNKEKEISEERKAYVEEKNKVIKLLEMSNEDGQITVCSLEEKVKLLEEEAQQHRRQQEKLEVELQNARQQLLVVPSSGEAKSSLEDRMVDSPDPTRHPSNINNGVLRSQESRIGQKEPFESEVMMAFFEEQMQGSYASSLGDVFKEVAEDSLPVSHSLPHITSQTKPNPNVVEEAVELDTIAVESTPLVEHQDEPGEPSSDECMQESDPSGLEMAKPHSLEKDFWSENSEFDSEEQVPPPAVESVIEVLKENELPPVSLVRPNDPVDYTRAPFELKRLRSRNHYKGHRTATDRRFWSIEQQDLYNFIYSRAGLFPMQWIDWDYIDSMDEFSCVRQRCAHVGLEQMMSYHCDWDIELIRQFYSTVYISDDNSSITWMADGRRVTTNKRAWEETFGIAGSIHTSRIHSEFFFDDDDKRIMYTAAECTVDQTRGLSPLASIANKIIWKTIYPKSSGSKVHGYNWNLLHHIVEQHPFDIIALIFDEIKLLISDHSPFLKKKKKDHSRTNLLYAPYIMGMIMRAFEYDGPRETRHQPYKPRPDKSKQTKKVGRPLAPAVVAPSEPPPSACQPEVEANVEADDHSQFEEAGHRPQGEAVQHTNASLSSQILAPRSSLTPSLEATTPSPPLAPAAFPEQASMMHAGLRCFSSASCFGAKSF